MTKEQELDQIIIREVSKLLTQQGSINESKLTEIDNQVSAAVKAYRNTPCETAKSVAGKKLEDD
jgi:ElaB/YqjD/DUF883 family membrane-anchored ribosome-binding protein